MKQKVLEVMPKDLLEDDIPSLSIDFIKDVVVVKT
jgi:hypothetical protein